MGQRIDDNPVAARKSLNFYHSAVQLRFDTWHRLKLYTERLSKRQARKADIAKFHKAVGDALKILNTIEDYTAFPSKADFLLFWKLFQREDYKSLARVVSRVVRALANHSYRRQYIPLARNLDSDLPDELDMGGALGDTSRNKGYSRPYFEVLGVEDISIEEEEALRRALREMRRPDDKFVYDVIMVPSFEDALIAVLFNYNIQTVVIRYGFPFRSNNHLDVLQRYLAGIDEAALEEETESDRGVLLGTVLAELRPELDIYLITDVSVEEIAASQAKHFRRIFYRQEDYLELHLSIMRGVGKRYETPFFTALSEYSRRPTGVFHAMPISRGKSVTKSHWIGDMAEFYGTNIFLAETSATSGGLDSLLQARGPIKKAQELAARAFGAKQTYFVTNGTSTANKIVVQALVEPGDIVLIDRDCHKSHHYGIVLAGAHAAYLDSYHLNEFSMYGAVPLETIKRTLLAYKRVNMLDRVKMLLLTNCTFDGVVYNVERVMEECLAIKPDLVFLWDEAWFAFACATPTYRRRTAMATAKRLQARYRTAEYRKEYNAFRRRLDKAEPDDEPTWLRRRLLPDPDRVKIRVYATHSTHKTLTSLRQGSMIHIFDQQFRVKVDEAFRDAYMTHTSTSPNYQILASLDVGRRQLELEGFELVQKQLELAMTLRERVATHPELSRYFRFLVAADLVPKRYRPSGIEAYFDPETGWKNNNMEEAWAVDDFVIDPSRLTLYIGKTGIDGDTFKNRYLMDKYGIQINKTSRNTVLFMTNIGTTRSSVAYLIEVLVKIAHELDEQWEESGREERRLLAKEVTSLTENLPPLPDFSRFHDVFRPGVSLDTPEGDMRAAYFLARDPDHVEYLRIDDGSADEQMASGRELVAAGFITPYPPGFPILVPGQVVSKSILSYMQVLDVKEIHGYQPRFGLPVFTEDALATVPKRVLPAPEEVVDVPLEAALKTVSTRTQSQPEKFADASIEAD